MQSLFSESRYLLVFTVLLFSFVRVLIFVVNRSTYVTQHDLVSGVRLFVRLFVLRWLMAVYHYYSYFL